MELWGGLECSVVRIGDAWRDQIKETGHQDRMDDLERIADLGIRVLRYPILWERVAPTAPWQQNWAWHDERMARLKSLGIRPIVGLVHHGSGPRYTNLLDHGFAEKLSEYAGRVAERFPWVEDWTPINEPVTTARFSGLYGHWYPHRNDLVSFCRMVVNQCHGIVLAMRAIRRIVPHARLVQTEDLGKSFSTPRLRYQADHENIRRWLSLDLLCGRVDATHPLAPLLRDAGASESALACLRDADAAPDVIGINHYLTSDRYLDEAVERYPPQFAGGNGRDTYSDVEAVRLVPHPGPVGAEARLREAWQRYGRPLAITEAHHGCLDMMECVRWLNEVWNAAVTLGKAGIDVRAVTVWSLFGSLDWRSLLRERHGAYEPGPFDASHSPPRPTALASAVRSLGVSGQIDDPEAHAPGWWHRPDREYPRRPARKIA